MVVWRRAAWTVLAPSPLPERTVMVTSGAPWTLLCRVLSVGAPEARPVRRIAVAAKDFMLIDVCVIEDINEGVSECGID
jgi:hypothetical protein